MSQRYSPEKFPLTMQTLSEKVKFDTSYSKEELLSASMYANLIRGASTLGDSAPASSGVCGVDVHDLSLVYGRTEALSGILSRMSDVPDVLLSSIITLREISKGGLFHGD